MFRNYSYNEILSRMLGNIPDDMDKRPSSPVFNGVAPAAMESADLYIERIIWEEQSFLTTAIGNNLDRVGSNFVIPRRLETHSVRTGNTFNQNGELFNVPIGSRFAVPETENKVTYVLTEYKETGRCLLRCEQAGTVGNEHYGILLPLQIINNLSKAELVGIHIEGYDREDDEAYRKRLSDRLGARGFGGNVADYKEYMKNIDGVGQVKVFPIWAGGGTVLVSALDSNNMPLTPEHLAYIKNIIDPEEDTGLGLGIAPIGHTVTIRTPEMFNIDIQCTLTLNNTTNSIIHESIVRALQNHFDFLISTWESTPRLTLFIARVITAIMAVGGVVNVQNVRLNGGTGDVILSDTAQKQFIPVLGNVILN
jgi:uncharacterized phage protein gp47/JayE